MNINYEREWKQKLKETNKGRGLDRIGVVVRREKMEREKRNTRKGEHEREIYIERERAAHVGRSSE